MSQAPTPAGGGVEFTSGSIPRHLVRFAVPMLVGNALQTAYNIVNSIWVGNGLGTGALAAVTVSFPIFFLLMAISGGISQASSILAAQAYGARDHAAVRRTLQNAALLNLLVAAACLAAGHLGADWLLRRMQTPAAVFTLAHGYLQVFLWTTPFLFGLFQLASGLRAVGDSKTPLRFQGWALLATAALDPVLMFGWFGAPRLGLNGAAWATILTQGAALAALTRHLLQTRSLAAPDLRGFRFDPAVCWLILKIGVPTMVQQGLVSVGMVVLISLVNRFGTIPAAAFGAAMRIDQFALLPAMTFSLAVSTLAGQNIGAGRFDRVPPVFWWGLLLSCSLTSVATGLALLAPAWVLRLFTQDLAVLDAGVAYLRIVGPGYLLFTVMFIGTGVVNGAGHTFVTTGISLIGLWLVRLPLAAWLSARLGRVEGVWYAMLAGFAVGMVLSLLYYFSGRWRRPVTVTRPPNPP